MWRYPNQTKTNILAGNQATTFCLCQRSPRNPRNAWLIAGEYLPMSTDVRRSIHIWRLDIQPPNRLLTPEAKTPSTCITSICWCYRCNWHPWNTDFVNISYWYLLITVRALTIWQPLHSSKIMNHNGYSEPLKQVICEWLTLPNIIWWGRCA